MEQIDQRASRLTIWFVGILGILGLVGTLAADLLILTKPADDAVKYLLVMQGFVALVGVIVGGLVNAMTTRSGSNADELAKVVELTQPHGGEQFGTIGTGPA